ncbi:MAG: hypothetical protein U0350_38910 [Caldilineaceae bacterium]
MTLATTPATVLNRVASALVAQQKYASMEDALWALALDTVRRKTSHYQRRIRKLERKYGVDFDTFTTQLKNKATPLEEDDWLAWRSARSMLADWQQTYQELLNAHAHY